MLDVTVGSSEVNLTRPKSVKQAWPLLSIRMLVLGSGELGCKRDAGFECVPLGDSHELLPGRAYRPTL